MNDDSQPSVLVEVFLSNGRIQGVTHEVHHRRRLVDILTEPDHAIRLESAKVILGSATEPREFASLNVEKRSILAAIPHETLRQQHQRLMITSTVGKRQTRLFQATLLLPPFIVEGVVHAPHSLANLGGKLTASPEIFGRFISVTAAKLYLPGGSVVESPVLLVNRDLIAGISVLEERGTIANTLAATG